MCTELSVDEIYPPTKFHNHTNYSFGDMLRTKFKYENKQRAITQKLSKKELWFMCTALPIDEIYPPTIFHNPSQYSFGDMHQTKVKYENKQRAITKKRKQTRVMVHVHCTPLDEIYPPTKFHNPT